MTLSLISLLLGCFLAAVYALMWVKPERTLSVMRRFPRSVIAAWGLTTVDLVWSGILLNQTPLGPVEPFKPWLWGVVPICIVLIVKFMPDLLAPRALGGLLILLPAPMLDVARWHPSPARLVITVIAYIMVLKGVTLVLAPYSMRKGVEWMGARIERMRACLAIGFAVGLSLIVLGVAVY